MTKYVYAKLVDFLKIDAKIIKKFPALASSSSLGRLGKIK